MANLPKPHPAGLRHARLLAARLREPPPQPSADLSSVARGSGNRVEALARVSQAMDDLYRWAQVHGAETPAGYRIEGLSGPGAGGAASVRQTTLDEALGQKYGEAYPEVKQSMLDAPAYRGIAYPVASQAEYLSNPFYVLTAESPNARNAARSNYIVLSPDESSRRGWDHGRVALHELGHAGTGDMILPGARRETLPRTDSMLESLARDYPSLSAHPRILAEFGRRTAYISRPEEIAANLNHMRGLHYGLTGDALLRPEDRVRYIQSIREAPLRDPGRPSMVADSMFADDPVMTHGPQAGRPAAGHNFMEQTLRKVLNNLDDRQMRALESIFNKSASVGARGPVHA